MTDLKLGATIPAFWSGTVKVGCPRHLLGLHATDPVRIFARKRRHRWMCRAFQGVQGVLDGSYFTESTGCSVCILTVAGCTKEPRHWQDARWCSRGSQGEWRFKPSQEVERLEPIVGSLCWRAMSVWVWRSALYSILYYICSFLWHSWAEHLGGVSEI